MEHLNITFPEDLKKALDHEAKFERIGRSTLIQKAVKIYLDLKKRKVLNNLLREGYLEMASVTEEVMRDFAKLDQESLKHVD